MIKQLFQQLLSTVFIPYPTSHAVSRYRLAVTLLAFFLVLPAMVQIFGTLFSPASREFFFEPSVLVRMFLLASEGVLLAGLLVLGLTRRSVWGYCFALLLAIQGVVWGVQGAVYPWFGPATPLELGVPVATLAVPWITLAVSLFVLLAIYKSRGLFARAFSSYSLSGAEETVTAPSVPKVRRTAVQSRVKPKGRKARAEKR